ncbi:endonuclease/exonuclease/phosphatase family protein [Nigerium massiliense]|uniref:endonuclease/exonuclease/phosphatase family protein n=1 Tax=Nigerium massiliense TaxID=1522317 RepID=UPI00058B2E93|nr:endonuclease/exonuclease/phosphatase family protein [Nigerium massiliense]
MPRPIVAAAIAFATAAACTLAPAPAAEARAQGPARPLTVVSYNIHHAQGADGVLDLERIASVLEDTHADVIGLQEVDNHWGARSGFADQADELARRLRMNVCFSANLDNPPVAGRTKRQQYGTAILSVYKLRNCRNTPLPNHPGGEQRGLAQADISVRGAQVRFYNTHLTHNSQPGRVAQAQVVNGIVQASGKTAILVGDLNAGPEAAEYGTYTAYLRDVWPMVGRGPGYTFDSDNPKGRIDYVLTTPDVTARRAKVVPTIASDHMPVVATLTVPKKAKHLRR